MEELKPARQVSREKYWDECGSDEKVERLRNELARACRSIERQSAQISMLLSHEHNGMGNIVVPLHSGSRGLSESSSGEFTVDRGIPFSLRTERERR